MRAVDPLPLLAARTPSGARFDVVGLGEASWDEVWLVADAVRAGGKTRALRRTALGGGQIATALCALSRLGRSTAWLGKLGDDDQGQAILEGLRIEGVDVTGARIVPGARSHAAVITVDASGDRTVLYDDDPATRMDRLELSPTEVTDGRVLHVDGTDLDAAIAAARMAREAGRVVSCDLDNKALRTEDLIKLVDICVVSTDLPRALTGEADLATALARIGRMGPALVVATLGAEGVAAWDGERVRRSPAFAMRDVVDTTACGDTFRAGFLCAFLEGKDLDKSLAFGCAAAALKTRDLGRRGCPSRDEVVALVGSAS